MKPILAPSQMQAADRAAIAELGIGETRLMELAGAQTVRLGLEALAIADPSGMHVLIACGRGNNGGDGFVIARHLLCMGAAVDLIILYPDRDLRGIGAENFTILRNFEAAGASIRIFEAYSEALPFVWETSYDLLVDAMIGTGLKLEGSGAVLSSPIAEGAGLLNALRNGSDAMTLAVDIPSGLDARTGLAAEDAVHADITITMAFEKWGCRLNEGPFLCGDIRVADISIPSSLVAEPSAYLVDETFAAAHFALRHERSAKHENGKVLVIAGSASPEGSMIGAAVLALRGALATGAGYLAVSLPASAAPVVHAAVPEAVVLGRQVETILERAGWADAILVGPGIGRDPEAIALVRALLEDEVVSGKKLVLDADALYALSEPGMESLLDGCHQALLTPHYGEFSRLSGLSVEEIGADPLKALRDYVDSRNTTLLLKGSPTLVTQPEGPVLFCTSGTEALASAGSGDVLAGMIAALSAKGESVADAAAAAAWIHGRAGDLACDISSLVSSSMVSDTVRSAIEELFDLE